jgi:putative IMPACT (imprinted ancient) family translation regulator
MPTLNVLIKEDITDCVVVVTRYFGGILLGGGGLVRAYSHSAKLGVDESKIITLMPWTVYKVSADYTFYNKLDSLIRDLGGVIENSDFSENVTLEFRLKKEMENKLFKECADLTNGKITPVECGTVIAEG